MTKTKRFFKIVFGLVLASVGVALISVLALYVYLAPQLPSVESLQDVQFQVPLRVYTQDEKLLGEFGEAKRTPVKYEEIPPLLVKALISAEDDRFFEHPGVDYHGLLRAVFVFATTGERQQGGSTITMQVARNFFLSREKTFARKLNEILLSFKIERELTKEQILELYLNKIYFGNRAYGVASAAQTYYAKKLDDLSLAEMAMIVGLPKAPSAYNPLVNAERAKKRRNYVLARMHGLSHIDDQSYESALAEPVVARIFGLTVEADGLYVAEMVRQELVSRFGDTAYTDGYKVYTTIDAASQSAATDAVRHALLDYERRHGYKGPLEKLTWVANSGPDEWTEALEKFESTANLHPALVVKVEDKKATVFLSNQSLLQIAWEDMSWARKAVDENTLGPVLKSAGDAVAVGDVVVVEVLNEKSARLAQIPSVSGALVSLDPNDGAIRALVGGFDFYRSKYNRITQAERQPGSSFKPFIYSAALEKEFTAASIINDAPVVFEDPALESAWRPENFSGKFAGPTRLREALIHSRNLVSIRLLQAIGIGYTVNYAARFGFNPAHLPRNLSLALGSGTVTPLELARGHAVFANGGFLITPYVISRIVDANGTVIWQAEPEVVCNDCDEKVATTADKSEESAAEPDASDGGEFANPGMPKIAKRVISAQNAYLMNSIMRDVVARGTGRKAMRIGRNDLAGKTGTTNDQRDAWFAGFNRDLLAIAWVGYDEPKPLGSEETGSGIALPMWTYFMEVALRGKPERLLDRPEGLVSVRIDPQTGELADSDNPNAIFEIFYADNVPTQHADSRSNGSGGDGGTPAAEDAIDQIF